MIHHRKSHSKKERICLPGSKKSIPNIPRMNETTSPGDDAQSDGSSQESPATSIPEDFDPGTSESDGEETHDSVTEERLQSDDSAEDSDSADSAESTDAAELPFRTGNWK